MSQYFPNETLAVAITIRQRGVDDIDSEIQRAAQGVFAVVRRDALPLLASDPPGSKTGLT